MPFTSTSRVVAVVMMCIVVGACASSGTVVLLPGERRPARPPSTVKQGDQELVLDQPYAAAKATSLGPRAYRSSAQEVESQFGSAIAAQPDRPTVFTLYFVEGKDEFTGESQAIVDQILSEIAERPVPDVLVVGHTDAVGNDQYNDALGLQRAETVRAALIRLGVPARRHPRDFARQARSCDPNGRRRCGAAQSQGRDYRSLKLADA